MPEREEIDAYYGSPLFASKTDERLPRCETCGDYIIDGFHCDGCLREPRECVCPKQAFA